MNGVHQSPHFDVSYSLTTTSADVVAFLLPSKKAVMGMQSPQRPAIIL
ncbi:hypothetical protein Nizo2766_1296 [Lactiplantibacillus plantarum]|uniref:Uncharacterized protein n=1 Tax=Lactiplantibacillus plantarum TaxID=1590 RepID=A0A165SAF0_LACPN|nr:Hypothetical protein zj316_3084 [Lactiplantibacillus plantarum ZJ316]AOG33013.1 Hypothetical protein AWV72_02242 [Lactiplantibacillus plantarum]KZU41920.1 hypothetical protein Nizo2757_2145 [Lactiplantibacillus plantarum]KZU46233.1 hypothetical protein Nizo2766_1296 [Lactiplantibacillus plantarum]KZU98380.1 hypothetical protein Lp19_0264 [Lactiplantibacillus plantarum]